MSNVAPHPTRIMATLENDYNLSQLFQNLDRIGVHPHTGHTGITTLLMLLRSLVQNKLSLSDPDLEIIHDNLANFYMFAKMRGKETQAEDQIGKIVTFLQQEVIDRTEQNRDIISFIIAIKDHMEDDVMAAVLMLDGTAKPAKTEVSDFFRPLNLIITFISHVMDGFRLKMAEREAFKQAEPFVPESIEPSLVSNLNPDALPQNVLQLTFDQGCPRDTIPHATKRQSIPEPYFDEGRVKDKMSKRFERSLDRNWKWVLPSVLAVLAGAAYNNLSQGDNSAEAVADGSVGIQDGVVANLEPVETIEAIEAQAPTAESVIGMETHKPEFETAQNTNTKPAQVAVQAAASVAPVAQPTAPAPQKVRVSYNDDDFTVTAPAPVITPAVATVEQESVSAPTAAQFNRFSKADIIMGYAPYSENSFLTMANSCERNAVCLDMLTAEMNVMVENSLTAPTLAPKPR